MANLQYLSEVSDLIDAYFEGLYQADVSMLEKVFHPDASYVNLVETEYLNTNIPEYFKMMKKRVSPADRKDERNDQILSVEFGGEKMAFVQVSLTMLGRNYHDQLTLSNDKYGWRIMTKLFHYQTFDKSKEPKVNEQDWLK